MQPRFTAEARAANQALVELLRRVADAKNASAAQVALAWLLAQKPWIVPIPGTRRLDRINENVGSAEILLTEDDLEQIQAAASLIEIKGARLPEELLQLTNR